MNIDEAFNIIDKAEVFGANLKLRPRPPFVPPSRRSVASHGVFPCRLYERERVDQQLLDAYSLSSRS